MATVRRIDSVGNYNIANTGIFDEYTTVAGVKQRIDSSGNLSTGGTGIFDEVTPLTAGSLSFNGSSQYLTLPMSTAFVFSGNFTFEAWIYPTQLPPSGGQYWIIGNWARSFYWILQNVSGVQNLVFAFSTDGTIGTVQSVTLPHSMVINNWYHIAAVRSGTTLTMYVNGVAIGSGSLTNTNYNSGSIAIGQITPGPVANYYYYGYMSNIRVVNGTALYTSNFTPSAIPFQSVANTSLLLSVLSSGTYITDSSPNAFTVTNNGTTYSGTVSPFIPVVPTGTYGGSLSISGGTQYLTLPSNAAFTFGTGNFTTEAWVYRTGVNPVNSTFSLNIFDFRSADPQVAIELYYDGTSGKIIQYVNGSAVLTGATTISLNTWYHVALVRSGTTSTLYINGVSDGTYNDSNNYATTGLTVGGRFAAVTGDYRCWQGYITNARIVKGAAVYTSNFTPSTLPLRNISGTSLLLVVSSSATYITDTSTNAFAVTNNGSVTYNTASPFTGSVVSKIDSSGNLYSGVGIFDEVSPISAGSLSFNGSTQYLSLADNAAFQMGTGNFTIEGWVYLTTVNSTQRRFYSQQNPGSTTVLWVGISTTNKFSAEMRSADGTNDVQVYSNTTPSINTWYHVAFVRSGTTTYLFVNGGLETTTNSMPQNISNSSIGVGVYYNPGGGGSPGDFWAGYITNLRVVKGTALYTQNFQPSAIPLQSVTNTSLMLSVLSSGGYITDSSTNAFTLTNNGTVTYSSTVTPYPF